MRRKLFSMKRCKQYFRSSLALMLALFTFMTSLPSVAHAKTAETLGRTATPLFSETAISAMQEVCGDAYNAQDVLSALYLLGAVDETGTPTIADSYVVDGVTVNTAQLRAMAYDHLLDGVETSVIDGVTVSWDTIRSLFAVTDMEEYLRQAEEQGIAMNDEAHIGNANKLIRWLASGGANLGDEWHKVEHVGHIGAEIIDDYIPMCYWWDNNGTIYEKYLVKSSTEMSGYRVGLFGKSGTTVSVSPAEVFATRYTSDYPDRLWLPSAQEKFVGNNNADYTLVIDKSGNKYNGEYEYLSQIDFYLNPAAAIANSGYDAQKVRIFLHAESKDDIARTDGGNLSLNWVDSSNRPVVAACEEITLDTDAYAEMVSETGLEIGVIDLADYRDMERLGDVYELYFSLRASSKPNQVESGKYYDSNDTFGCIRAAGLYMTFEVTGERIAPTVAKNNTRLWLVPVDNTDDTYKLNPYYHDLEAEAYGYRMKPDSEYYIPNIAEKIAANGYVDLLDKPSYIYYLLHRDFENEKTFLFNTSDVPLNSSTQIRIFLKPVDPLGTEYTIDVDKTIKGHKVENYQDRFIRRFALTEDLVYDIPDELLTHTLTYSFMDYDVSIENGYEAIDSSVLIGELKVNKNSASIGWKASSNGYNTLVPALFWDSVSNSLTKFNDYVPYQQMEGTISINYDNGGRAVLVQSRMLSYLIPYNLQNLKSGSAFNHLTETEWAFSQYGLYNDDDGTSFTGYDFGYNTNPASEQNLHIIAPAMTYYPGDVIPIIVRNPNGVFGTAEGSNDSERKEWANGFRLTVNNRTLTPSEATFRQNDKGGYGVDMLVFLYTVDEYEADVLQIGLATISYNGGDEYRLINDLGGDPDHYIPEETVKMKTFDWSSMLLVEDSEVVSVGSKNYLEIPIRTFTAEEDPDGSMKSALYNQLNNWIDAQNNYIVKNAFAILSMNGDPRVAEERVPFYAVVSGIGTTNETYKCIRVELLSQDENGGSNVVPVRIYTGVPVTGGNYVSYDSNELVNNNWNCDGFSVEGGRYHIMTTWFATLPKITYFEDDSAISMIYNDGWNNWADALKYRSYKRNDKPVIALSYLAKTKNEEGIAYTYTAPENFSWKSSNESIATIKGTVQDGVTIGVITPTGVTGDVTFTLVCENGGGDHVIEIKSLTMHVVEDSEEAYLMIPEMLSSIIVRKNAAASVTFASNIQQMNATENVNSTDFTLKVYEATLSGGKLVKASDTPIYSKTETATSENPVYAIQIPENKLSIVSPSGSESYLAEVTAEFKGSEDKLPEGMTDGIFVAEVPIKVRNYPIELTLSSNDKAYMLGGQTYTANWAVSNANASYDWRYYITDENGNVLKEYDNSGNGTFDKTSLTFEAPDVTGVLKRSYTLNIAASNDVDGEGWTMAVKTLYVYNGDALKILVEESERVSVSGDTVTMDNRSWLQKYLSADNKTINLGSEGISFGSLQTDAHLDSLISLNYGEYAWGLISDAIEWKVTGSNDEDPIDFYYKKMGIFSDTETSGLETYLPTTDFSLIAVKDGTATVTAKHALSGIQSSVTVNVDVLDHELVLFQFYPATVTNVTYTLENEKTYTVSSDANGQLALYEANGLDNDTHFYMTSTYNGTEYVGMSTMGVLKSGERNALNGKTYPVNLVKLQRPAEIHLYFNDEEGNAIKEDSFTVRGGVYYDGKYAESADLFDESNRALGVLGGDDSSGLNDLTYSSDANGMIKVFFNTSQFDNSGEIDPTKSLLYIFEVRKDGYLPELVYVFPYEESNVVVNLKSVDDDKKEQPFLWEFNVQMLRENGELFGYLPMDESTTNIGPSVDHTRVLFDAQTALWGMDNLVDRTSGVTEVAANPGSQYYTDAGLTSLVGNGQTLNSQKYEFWSYPFSSFVFCETTLEANTLSLAWLEEKTAAPMDLLLFDNAGEIAVKFPFEYSLYKSLEVVLPAESPSLTQEAEAQQDATEETMEDFKIGDLVPGGDIMATGLKFLTSSASGGDYGVYFKISPTADPSVFYVMISIGDEDPNDDDKNNDSKHKLEPSYEDIQSLGGELITEIRGTQYHTRDYEMKKKGLAAQLKKEQEDFLVVSKDKKEEKKEDKKDDDDDDDGIPAKIGGSLLARATYNKEKKDWDLTLCGGSVSLKCQMIEYEYHKNIIVGYVPFTFSIGAKAELSADIGVRETKWPKEGLEDSLYYVKGDLKAELEGFGGLGLDMSIIAVKIGLYGKFELEAEVTAVKTYKDSYMGAQLTLKGELGFKVVFKALVIDYEYEIFSILKFDDDDAKVYTVGDYEKVQNIWEGKTITGKSYRAASTSDGRIIYSMEKAVAAAPLMAPATQNGTSIFRTYAKDTTLDRIIFSTDGSEIFYLDDGVAFTADVKGITENAIAADEENDYGQFYLDAAGQGENYVAAWVTQTTETLFDDQYEPTPADLAAAMNSTEITAAMYKNGVWTTTALTENNGPDLAPTIDISDNGRYVVVAWRSVYTSNPDEPLNFDVDDNVLYRIYDTVTGEWTTAETAYNGLANGSVKALDAAVFDNGNILIAFTVQTGIDSVEESNGLETYYTFLENTAAGRKNTTVRVTDNKYIDSNVQLLKITENDTEYAILGWYSADENADINLRVFDKDGNIDDSYPSSVKAVCDERISESFHLAGSSKENLMIGWINARMEDGAIAASADLYAVRMYKSGTNEYHVVPAQLLASTEKNVSVDDFTLYFDGTEVKAILSETDYSKGDTEVAATLTLDDVVKKELYTDEEEYKKDCALFLEQYPNGTMDLIVPVGYFKTEMKTAEFKNEIKVTKIRYNQDTVAPMLNVPVQFTIENDGCIPIEELSINGVLFDNLSIQPGEDIRLTYDYTMDSQAGDEYYTIEVEGSTLFNSIEDTIYFNTPEVEIKDARESVVAEGKRTVLVRLGNNNMIPAANAKRTYHVSVYADADCTILVGEADLDENQAKLLDENATVVSLELDPKEILTKLNKAGEEIPETGLILYVQADTCLTNGEVLDSSYDVVFLSTLCKNIDEPIAVETPDFEISGDTVTGEFTVMNTSLYDQGDMNLGVTVHDENGQILAMQLFTDVPMTSEHVYKDTFSIPMADPSKVAYVTVEILEEAELPTLTDQKLLFAGWYSDTELTQEWTNSNSIGYAKWEVPVVNIEGIHLNISGDIGMVFHVAISDEAKDGKMVLSAQGEELATIKPEDCEQDSEGRYLFTCRLNSIQMSEKVTATYSWGEDESVTKSVSIEEYADLILKLGGYSDEAKDMVKALINYGHYAQLFLADENGWEIGTDYAETKTTYGSLTATAEDFAKYSIVKSGSDDTIKGTGIRLRLDSKTSLSLQFATDEKPSVTIDGVPVDVVKDGNGVYSISIKNIGAQNLAKEYTIVVNGKLTYKLSALSYANILMNGIYSDKAKNAMKALYEYYRACDAYVTSLD